MSANVCDKVAANVALLSVPEAARLMRCRRQHVRELLSSGALPYIDRGARRYIRVRDLAAMLEAQARRRTFKRDPRSRRGAPIDRALLTPATPGMARFLQPGP